MGAPFAAVFLAILAWAGPGHSVAHPIDNQGTNQDSELRTTALDPLPIPGAQDGTSTGLGAISHVSGTEAPAVSLTQELAIDLAYKYAGQALQAIVEEGDEDKYGVVLAILARKVASLFPHHLFQIELRGKGQTSIFSTSGTVPTDAWTSCKTCKPSTAYGTAEKGVYESLAKVTYHEDTETPFADPYPIREEQKRLPPFLSSEQAKSFAVETATNVAKKLAKLGATPGYIHVAIKNWTEGIVDYNSNTHFALEMTAGYKRHFPIVRHSAVAKKWSDHPSRSTNKYEEADVRQGPYRVKVNVYYVELD